VKHDDTKPLLQVFCCPQFTRVLCTGTGGDLVIYPSVWLTTLSISSNTDLIYDGLCAMGTRRVIIMAKNNRDLILRDRLTFTPSSTGGQSTLYGRFDLSEFTSTLERKGLSIKEVNFMLRSPSAGDTGNFILSQGQFGNTSLDGISTAQLKLFATTRAYEAAADVGIASPDVLHIETFTTYLGPAIAGAAVPPGSSTYMYADHMVYPTQNLHPSGFPVVTDLLIGVAASNWSEQASKVIELDVMIIAEPITITAKDLTEMLVQGSDQ